MRFSEFCNHLYYSVQFLLAHDECTLADSKPQNRYCESCDEFSADEYFPQLRECVHEAARVFPTVNNTYVNLTDAQLAQLFINTTACVLAKTRCSYMNPVTGELQDDDILNKLHLPSLNAILVNTDYDINIVQLPFRYGSFDVCAKYRNIQQATWPSVAC